MTYEEALKIIQENIKLLSDQSCASHTIDERIIKSFHNFDLDKLETAFSKEGISEQNQLEIIRAIIVLNDQTIKCDFNPEMADQLNLFQLSLERNLAHEPIDYGVVKIGGNVEADISKID